MPQIKQMSAGEYRKALYTLKLNHHEAGAKLGFTDRHSRRYAEGTSPVPTAVSELLKVWLEEKRSGR